MHSVNSGAHPTCLGWIPRPDVLKPLHVTFRRVVAALEDLVRALEFVHVNSPRRTWRHRKVCCEIAAASRRARRRGSTAARSGVALIAPGWERGVSKKLPCARRAPPGRERDQAPACDWPLRSRRGGCGTARWTSAGPSGSRAPRNRSAHRPKECSAWTQARHWRSSAGALHSVPGPACAAGQCGVNRSTRTPGGMPGLKSRLWVSVNSKSGLSGGSSATAQGMT